MKDEIKEILDELESMFEISELEEQVNNINKIKDYITNLQEENEKTNIQANYFMNRNDDLEEIIDDYKSRIDKAIEFLDNEYNYKKGDAKFNRTDYVIWQSLKNILNGGNE